ncbi:MAG: hypothetical protein ABI843_11295 [Dokdonella sp.]
MFLPIERFVSLRHGDNLPAAALGTQVAGGLVALPVAKESK